MLTLAGHTAPVRCVAYSPDGRLLASGGEDGTVRLWDLAGREGPHVWPGLSFSVEAIAFAPDGSLLLAGQATGKLAAITLGGRKVQWQQSAHPQGVRAVVVHPAGDRAYTTGWDRRVCAWLLRKPDPVRLGPALPDTPAAMALSPDGKTLAIGFTHTDKVALIDSTTGQRQRSLTSDDGSVFALAFSPDGQLLAAGDSRGRVLLWEPARPERPRTLEGHTWTIYGLAFTPDGRRLVSAGADHTARVWDVASGGPLHVYEWHKHWMTCLALSPDGLTAATGGEDRIVAVWDVPE